ncbi:hypothetical protein JYT23_01345 [Mariprofundus ferrooxydans]|nr:hypothetical protein [Mariprofundus ferrooxydans]
MWKNQSLPGGSTSARDDFHFYRRQAALTVLTARSGAEAGQSHDDCCNFHVEGGS